MCAVRAYSSGSDSSVSEAEYVLNKLREYRRSRVSGRELLHICRKFSRNEELIHPIEKLSELGWLREIPTEYIGSGRKPSKSYEVNPKVFTTSNEPNAPRLFCGSSRVVERRLHSDKRLLRCDTMSHQKGTADMNENIKQSVTMTPKMCDEIEKYSLNHHISKSQAIRALIEKALTQDTLVGEQGIIRRYIRDELEVVIPNIREIKDIKEYAQLSSKSSAVAMLCICRVLYDICQDWCRVDEYFARSIVASMSMNGERPTSVDEQLRFVEGWIKSVFEI